VLLVFILVVMWSVYLGMGLVSARERRSMNSIATFNQHLAVLARTTPARTVPSRPVPGRPPLPAYAPPQRGMTLAEARNRRRQMLTGLAVAASVTAALAVVGGFPFLVVHLVADAMLAGYVALLIRTRQPQVRRSQGRRSSVVYLPRLASPIVPEPVYLHRSAN
jgi:hypothetical protein